MPTTLDRLRDRHGPLRGPRLAVLVLASVVAALGIVTAVTASGAVAVVGAVVAVLALPAAVTFVIGDARSLGVEGRTRTEALAAELAVATTRMDVLEQVLADATRRPWSPTLLPWELAELPSRPVVLLPGADYHLPELVELAGELHRHDVPTVVACGRPHWDRTAEGLASYPGLRVVEAPTADQLVATAAAVVTMKDWAGYGPLVEAANDAGIPTFAKVEGVQDYHDVDTGEELARRPYRTARTILCQGRNDAENLPGDTRIVGSTRLERLWWAPPTRVHRPLVVVNLNFTYGVLAAARTTYLNTAVAACEAAGLDYVISLHPAERARTLHPRTSSIGISRLLERASFLVSRFSTAGFEAMARGVPFAYHNPHGEQVGTFQRPHGAFDLTTDADELAAAIRSSDGPGQYTRDRAADFLGAQIDIDSERTSAQRGADVVLDGLG